MGGLGFRDLICFNRALLAKQGWRILNDPFSLLARVYKQKYFPHNQFLESTTGYCPSLIWRSICSVMDLVQQGCVWHVGNGKNIKIWKDKWIPIPSTF